MEQHVLLADAMVGKYRVKIFRTVAGVVSGHATGPKGSQPFTVQSDGGPHWVYGAGFGEIAYLVTGIRKLIAKSL